MFYNVIYAFYEVLSISVWFYMVLTFGSVFSLAHACLRVPSYHDSRKVKTEKTDEDSVIDNIENSDAV